ncbi:MAG: acyl-CoA dehydrogenase family protein [Desulfobacteraceae bacterium]|nr:acyl-CoA dehydrogenase family protein [Desulfobacteraceae bacterium]
MDFSYTDEQIDLRESIIKFSEQELNHDIAEHDKKGIFPTDKWQKCADMQIMALPFPEEYGGHGANFLTTVLSYNALGYACKDAGLVHAIGTQILCGFQILLFGNDDQKKNLLPAVCSGEKVFAQAITEPGSGSDALSMRTKAEKTNDNSYVLNGSKTFITNGPIADVVVVFTVTDPAKKTLGGISCLIVEKEFAGFERCKPLEKMGLKTLQNGELVFDNCTVPQTNLLGREGQGALIFNESMELERCFLPAAHLGTMERVIEKCVRYVNERSAFGNTIGKFQSVANKIAQMKVNIELSKLMLYKAATLKDQKKRAALEASITKLFISESLKKSCLDAVQIHGGYGFMTEYEIERDLRDSIAATIYSGTSEMQHNIIARLLGL